MRIINRNPGAASLAFMGGAFGIFSLMIINRRELTADQLIQLSFVVMGSTGLSIIYFKKWLLSENAYILFPLPGMLLSQMISENDPQQLELN